MTRGIQTRADMSSQEQTCAVGYIIILYRIRDFFGLVVYAVTDMAELSELIQTKRIRISSEHVLQFSGLSNFSYKVS